MIFIIKDNFEQELKKLSKKYKLIFDDFDYFKKTFDINNWKHLWKWIYKFRLKNSSTPVWKSWGFRIIMLAKLEDNKIMPFIIYSKTDLENVSLEYIINELKKYL